SDVVDYLNIFQRIRYEKGVFTFKWSEDMIPHILNLKDHYNLTDLEVKSNFKSSFSWTLYDYLKSHYGYWHKPISKEALMKIFNVENIKSYQNNTGLFKNKVLDSAIAEINQYTELEVRYEVEKQGRAISGFDLIWSTGTNIKSATKKQIKELKTLIDVIVKDEYKYIDLNEQEDRQNAIKLIQEIKRMTIHTQEPICLTYDKADWFIKQANSTLKSLENLYSRRDRKVLYYDWREDD
ncbi:replication initiation protein, partial [Kordiimonas lipolytica]